MTFCSPFLFFPICDDLSSQFVTNSFDRRRLRGDILQCSLTYFISLYSVTCLVDILEPGCLDVLSAAARRHGRDVRAAGHSFVHGERRVYRRRRRSSLGKSFSAKLHPYCLPKPRVVVARAWIRLLQPPSLLI
eukprot:3074925-Pleurochrysis_carterae.AAC.1